MPTRKQTESKPPDLAPERALREFETQLATLMNFKGRNYFDVRQEFEEWQHYTKTLIEKTFGNASSNLSGFYRVLQRGDFNIMGIPSPVQQRNFQRFVEGYEPLLNSMIREIRLKLPENEVKGAYEPGQEFEVYRDLKKLIDSAKGEIFLIDNYLDRELFELYVDKVAAGIQIRLLTGKVSSDVETVAKKYVAGHKAFHLHVTRDVHVRILFVDNRCWVIGQSIKDAAKRKPTYIIEVSEPEHRSIYEPIWNASTPVV